MDKSSPKGTRLKITSEELRDFYENRKMTTYEIAEMFNCCQASIWKRLKQFGIKARKPHELFSKIPSKQDLQKWYAEEMLSTWEIEKRFGYSRGTVHKKLKEFGIKVRSRAASHIIHPRKDFSGNLLEKAYLIGFRIGDLRVRKMYENSESVSVECGTTKQEQLDLIEGLFENYGGVWITKKNKIGAKNIGVNLSLSFDFLLTKLAPDWVFENEDYFFSFLAGFSDAEGHISISNKQAFFAIGNYDKPLLEKIRQTLINFGINCRPLHLGTKKGYVDSEGYVRNGDYWHFRLSKKIDLLKTLNSMKPFVKHSAKVKAVERAIKNIEERNLKFGNINM